MIPDGPHSEVSGIGGVGATRSAFVHGVPKDVTRRLRQRARPCTILLNVPAAFHVSTSLTEHTGEEIFMHLGSVIERQQECP